MTFIALLAPWARPNNFVGVFDAPLNAIPTTEVVKNTVQATWLDLLDGPEDI